MVGRRLHATRLGRRLAAPAALAVAMGIATAAEVFACTATMGPLTFNPPSGPAGSVVLTTASGLKPYPARYDLYFGGECMTFTGKLVKVITPDLNGAWSNVAVTIPKKAKPGVHSFCGIEAYPNPGQTATSHSSFTVV